MDFKTKTPEKQTIIISGKLTLPFYIGSIHLQSRSIFQSAMLGYRSVERLERKLGMFASIKKHALPSPSLTWNPKMLVSKRNLLLQGAIFRWTMLKFGRNYMGVSKNSGTPKSSILIRFSIINHPFWGTPIFGNTHISVCSLKQKNFQSSHFCSVLRPLHWGFNFQVVQAKQKSLRPFLAKFHEEQNSKDKVGNLLFWWSWCKHVFPKNH